MAKTLTKNYQLTLDDENEFYDINTVNSNLETIDKALTPKADSNLEPVGDTESTLANWVSWFANRFKRITGKSNWWEAPVKSIQEIHEVTVIQSQKHDDLLGSVSVLVDKSTTHIADTQMHVTSEEKASWNQYSELANNAISISVKNSRQVLLQEEQQTSFLPDGSILVESDKLRVRTVFNIDGSVTELYLIEGKEFSKTITFNSDGSVTEKTHQGGV